MSFDDVTAWIEAHPVEAALIGGAGAIGVLWLLGFFGGGTAPASSGGQGLVAAYYGAEANQAAIGAQLQAAQISATRDTAIAGLQASTAQAIAATQYGAAVTINGQNASAATTVNAQTIAGSTAIANDQLLAAEAGYTATVTENASNNAALIATTADKDKTAVLQTIYGKVIPTELLLTGGKTGTVNLPGSGNITFGAAGRQPNFKTLTPKQAKAAGFTPPQYTRLTGLPATWKQWAGL